MSHVATIDIHITDLQSLAAAAKQLGMVLNINQQTYRWFGRHVGDYPIPAGYTVADLGRCAHAISIPGNNNAYEIGVCERRDGKPGYILMWDFWAGGHGLQQKVGADCIKLRQEYALAVAAKKLRAKGFNVVRDKTSQTPRLRATRVVR